MAFQDKQPLFALVQDVAGGAVPDEAAPAENYILDERVPDAREDDFLSFNGFSAVSSLSRDAWFKHHADYGIAKVARAVVSATFDTVNQTNWLGLDPDWDVVRIETVSGLCGRAPASGVSEAEASDLIQDMLAAREAGNTLSPLREARLEKWLRLVNAGRDRRPTYVAPFAEVEDILQRPDWANRLRDALGLGHIRPSAGRPTPVVLMQYNLRRVHDAHIGKAAWAASPTVLDDVPRTMPNPCFFPAPKNASADGYGFTVDLDATDATWRKEFLHGHINYTVADFRRVGEITLDVSSARIADARKDHRSLLASDLRHLSDLPAKP